MGSRRRAREGQGAWPAGPRLRWGPGRSREALQPALRQDRRHERSAGGSRAASCRPLSTAPRLRPGPPSFPSSPPRPGTPPQRRAGAAPSSPNFSAAAPRPTPARRSRTGVCTHSAAAASRSWPGREPLLRVPSSALRGPSGLARPAPLLPLPPARRPAPSSPRPPPPAAR